jgi:hypothetical protein
MSEPRASLSSVPHGSGRPRSFIASPIGAGAPPSLRLLDGCDDKEAPAVNDGTGLAEALLGLSGFRVLEVMETDAEVVIDIETVADVAGCAECGVRAEAQDRSTVEIRDLACFGRAARLVWRKRRWRCADDDCEARTWTDASPHISARTVLTDRAGWEAGARWGPTPAPWPAWPGSSACAGRRSWAPSSSTASRSWTTPPGWVRCSHHGAGGGCRLPRPGASAAPPAYESRTCRGPGAARRAPAGCHRTGGSSGGCRR